MTLCNFQLDYYNADLCNFLVLSKFVDYVICIAKLIVLFAYFVLSFLPDGCRKTNTADQQMSVMSVESESHANGKAHTHRHT